MTGNNDWDSCEPAWTGTLMNLEAHLGRLVGASTSISTTNFKTNTECMNRYIDANPVRLYIFTVLLITSEA